jgi:hypothetical protein
VWLDSSIGCHTLPGVIDRVYASAVVLPIQTARAIKIGRHLQQLVLSRGRRRGTVLRGLSLGGLTLLLQPNILRGRGGPAGRPAHCVGRSSAIRTTTPVARTSAALRDASDVLRTEEPASEI